MHLHLNKLNEIHAKINQYRKHSHEISKLEYNKRVALTSIQQLKENHDKYKNSCLLTNIETEDNFNLTAILRSFKNMLALLNEINAQTQHQAERMDSIRAKEALLEARMANLQCLIESKIN